MQTGIITMRCERCGKTDVTSVTVSYFNTQIICENCESTERAHPEFRTAKNAELDAILKGDLFYKGIGLPKDLNRA